MRRNIDFGHSRISGARFAAALALIALAGCTGIGARQDGFESATTRLFTVSYDSIAERYIEPISIETMAMAGLSGLSAIDPKVSVARSGQVVTLDARSTLVRFAAPAGMDARGWAALTTSAVTAGRDHSELLRAAKDDAIYQALFDGAISRLDGFTRYLNPDNAREERARRLGYGGIGIRLQAVEGRVEILSVMPGTPAAAAGLLAGDRILRVDNALVLGWELREVIDKLRGNVNSKLAIEIARPGGKAPAVFQMVREKIVPQTVTAKNDGRHLEIKISNFNQDTYRTVQQQIAETRRRMGPALAGIVLDLRDNPGGLMDQAVRVADLFLRKGTISTARGRHPESVQHFDASGEDASGGLPMAVLVNGATASAAEVVTAAMQDNGRAIVIGTTTYGKGTVQTINELPNAGELVVTWSRLHAPSGYAIHKLGVSPSVCTSGGIEGVARIVESVRTRANETQALLARWRAQIFTDPEMNDRLRSACRPEKISRELDMEVAHALLDDVMAYRQAIRITYGEVAHQ